MPPVTRSVSAIATTPVKAFALAFPERVLLGADGVEDDRRFLLVSASGARLRSAAHAWPCRLTALYDTAGERLTIRFPDGSEASGATSGAGDEVELDYHGNTVGGRVVDGPWSERLSELAGEPIRLV